MKRFPQENLDQLAFSLRFEKAIELFHYAAMKMAESRHDFEFQVMQGIVILQC